MAGAPLEVDVASDVALDPTAILALSDEMRSFLRAHVEPATRGAPRLRRLAEAILDESLFGLEYDTTTRTAADTFADRRGNCMAFTNMFVAMARHVGLDAHYQEVDAPPDWSVDEETFVLNRHVNVWIDLGLEGEHMVDFNLAEFRTSYDRRRVDDARARAHHYNNVAVERMLAGDIAAALTSFRVAAANDPSFSPVWTNLGTLYLKNGHDAYAEASYLEALRANSEDSVAMSSLARLYERRGQTKRAERFRQRVRAHRMRNPYHRYQLAQEAFEAGDYGAAVDHLEYAVRIKDNEDRFFFLLGRACLALGDDERAAHWLARAEDVASTDAMKRRYHQKLEVLLAASPDD